MLDTVSRVVIFAVVLTTVIKSAITDNFRLVKGRNESHEVVEVFNNTTMQWLRVCNDTWGSSEALSAVCEELGYTELSTADNLSSCDLGEEIQTCVVLNCTNTLSLNTCTMGEVRTASCADAEIMCEDAGISSLHYILEVAIPLLAVLATATTATVVGCVAWRKRQQKQQQQKSSSEEPEVNHEPTRSSDDSDVHCQYAVNPSYKETTREQISRSNSFTDSSYTESIPRKDALLCTQNQEDCQREMENIAANGYQLEPATPTSCTVTPTNPAPIYWNFKELQAVNKKPADTTVQYENPLKLLRKKSIDKPLLHNIKSGNQEIQEEVLLTPYEVPYKSTLV